MNTNRNSDSESNSPELVSTFTTDFAGIQRVGRKSKDTSVYCHKSKTEDQAKRVKGSKGVSEVQRSNLFQIVGCLNYFHPNELAWLILTYTNLNNAEYERFHTSFPEISKKLKYQLNSRYKHSDLASWVLKYELSPTRTRASGKPHFDINICLHYLDENGQPLFDKDQLISDCYRAINKAANTALTRPPDQYFEVIKPFNGEFRNWSSYFCKETDSVLLASIKANKLDHYLPKNWFVCPKALREEATYKEMIVSNLTHKEVIELDKDEFRDEIEAVEENKNGAYIKTKLENYDPYEAMDRMESRISEKTDQIERY